ncbi:MAG: CBS domain-containing protein [Proteobacteria bacterium]|nr:CBS domain-containing protein [Pseudomonadota bacterium]
MVTTAPDTLIRTNLDFLRRHPPFDRMEPEALHFLGERLATAFYPADSEILMPEDGPPSFFYIVYRGKVQARQVGGVAVTEYATLTLGPGEGFPIGAISAGRPSTNGYIAVEDSYCFQLPAADFLHLQEISPSFQLFCTRYIASLLNQSREQLQIQFSQRAAEQQTMTTPLSSLVKKAPVFVAPGLSTRTALEKMVEAGVGCLAIAGDDDKPVGVLTQSDILKRIVLPGFDLTRPIADVMTAPPHTLGTNASAYDAALEMATHGVRHILVVDTEGTLKGVISERDLFALQRIGLRQIRSSIESAANVQTLQQASQDIRQLALNLLAQGIGAEQLTQFISALNDALTRRIIELNLDRHDLYGVEYAWLAFGSEGRHEQTLSTDQDNGIIYVLPEWADKEPLKLRLLEFARDVNNDLASCGFPLCTGNIMASNPDLCLTIDEWRERFGTWIREPHPEALLNATIFFDFRVLLGDEKLAYKLRHWLLSMTGGNPAFLKAMATNALDVSPPLGKIRDFVTDDDPKYPGTIDLKKFGARLFVDAARVLALRTGVEATSTVQRLRQGGGRIGMPAEELSAMADGFHFIQLLRLRHQHLDTDHGAPGDNRVKPDDLNELDRRILKEAFRQARKIQLRLKLDYQI